MTHFTAPTSIHLPKQPASNSRILRKTSFSQSRITSGNAYISSLSNTALQTPLFWINQHLFNYLIQFPRRLLRQSVILYFSAQACSLHLPNFEDLQRLNLSLILPTDQSVHVGDKISTHLVSDMRFPFFQRRLSGKCRIFENRRHQS